MSTPGRKEEIVSSVLTFDDNSLLSALFGEHDSHLARIEQELDLSMIPRGNVVSMKGEIHAVNRAAATLRELYHRLQKKMDVTMADVDGALRMSRLAGYEEIHPADTKAKKRKHGREKPSRTPAAFDEDAVVRTEKRVIVPRSPRQAEYVKSLRQNELTFGLGPAGTGKTYLAIAVAVTMLLNNEVDRIIMTRPAVEAGERLGFLPGGLDEKIDPYMRPMYDALYDALPGQRVVALRDAGDIEVAPLAYMRGRTLANAFIILDEAQNTTPMQMKMFLTRMGENSRMAVTGDISQADLPLGQKSGLQDALEIISDLPEVSIINFDHRDVVRHSLVTKVVRAYDGRDRDLLKSKT